MKFCIMIAFIIALFSNKAFAWSYGDFVSCDALNPRPVVTFKTSYGQLFHDFSKSKDEITGISKSLSADNEKASIVGLAALNYSRYIWLKKVKIRKIGANTYCVLPEEIEIMFGYKEPVVYVSNQYDKQSCEFSMVIRHEQVHQRINKLTLEHYLPIMDEALREAIAQVRAIKVSDKSDERIKQGMEVLKNHYYARMDSIFEQFKIAREAEQQKLDNQTNYTSEWDLCKRGNAKKEATSLNNY